MCNDLQELSGDESKTDAITIGSIACDSVVTSLLYQHGKLFVGQADRLIKVYMCHAICRIKSLSLSPVLAKIVTSWM